MNRAKEIRPDTFKTFKKQDGSITNDILTKFLNRCSGPDISELRLGHQPLNDISEEELRFVSSRLKTSATGLDGTTSVILKYFLRESPETSGILRGLFQPADSVYGLSTCLEGKLVSKKGKKRSQSSQRSASSTRRCTCTESNASCRPQTSAATLSTVSQLTASTGCAIRTTELDERGRVDIDLPVLQISSLLRRHFAILWD